VSRGRRKASGRAVLFGFAPIAWHRPLQRRVKAARCRENRETTMPHLKLKTSKPTAKKNNRSNYIAPACRRCGTTCNCSEEEIDAGGPA